MAIFCQHPSRKRGVSFDPMSGRAAEIAAVSRAAEAALADMAGQTMVEGWGNV